MVLPLNEVQTKQHMASKPGNIKDEYIRVQDINMAIDECKIALISLNALFKESIIQLVDLHNEKQCEIIDKWLKVTK
jgi:hypothetical protein